MSGTYKKLMMAAAFGLAGLMTVPAAAQYNGQYDPNANNRGWHQGQHDRDRDRRGGYYGDGQNGNYANESQSKAYQQGYKDGLWDNQHGPQNRNRSWKNAYDARAYRDGYNAAYRGAADGQHGNGGWGRGGYGNGRHGNGQYGGYGNGQYGGYGNGQYGGYGNGGYGNGQYSGYGNGGYGNGQYGGYGNVGQIAYNNGYQQGLRLGSNDRSTGHSYRPTHDDRYRDGDGGYSSSYGDKNAYKDAFRQGYLAGYQRGYGRGR